MSIDSDKKSQPFESDLDIRTIHEMERRIAAKEASAEWKLWSIVLVGVLLFSGLLMLGVWLLPFVLMGASN